MSGVRKEEINPKCTHLVEYMDDKYPFYLDQCQTFILLEIHKPQ